MSRSSSFSRIACSTAAAAAAGAAMGQEPVSSALDLHGPWEVPLVASLRSSIGPGFVSMTDENGLAVSTRRAGALVDDYDYWRIGAHLRVPFRFHGRSGSLDFRHSSTLAEGSYSDANNYARARGVFTDLAATATCQIAARTTARLSYARYRTDALARSTYLAGVFNLFGADPDLVWNRTTDEEQLSVEQRLFRGWTLGADVGRSQAGGKIAAQNSSASASVAVPTGVNGYTEGVRVSRRLSGADTVSFGLSSSNRDGTGNVVRESGLRVGDGTAGERSRDIAALFDRSLRNGGDVGFRYENLAASTRYDGVVYDPVDAGIPGSSGTLVGYGARLVSRRSELGVRWRAPQGPRRSLEIGYRQVWLQGDALSSYAASVFIFGIQGSSSIGYPDVRLGILSAAYELPVRTASLRFEAVQAIPYHLQNELAGAPGPIASGPSIQSTGGWTLAATLQFKF